MCHELRRYWPQIKGGNSGFILGYRLELFFMMKGFTPDSIIMKLQQSCASLGKCNKKKKKYKILHPTMGGGPTPNPVAID